MQSLKAKIDAGPVRLPTKFGEFSLYVFSVGDKKEHVALVKNSNKKGCIPLVRIHSECFTGDVLGSQRCDCNAQLHKAVELISKEECGALLYLRQEGRGIGLTNKIKAYALQDGGLDTVEANIKLGFKADERDFSVAPKILSSLGFTKVKLLTNNPSKVKDLEKGEIEVVERVSLIVGKNFDNEGYLKVKQDKLGQLLELKYDD